MRSVECEDCGFRCCQESSGSYIREVAIETYFKEAKTIEWKIVCIDCVRNYERRENGISRRRTASKTRERVTSN